MDLIFEWDARKAKENLKKHKVSFEEAKSIFNDPYLLTYQDVFHSDHEDRYISIGTSYKMRVLLVVHTEVGEDGDTTIIRMISCRKATHLEIRFYEEGLE